MAVCVLSLFLAADYQLRRRSQEATVVGAVDIAVLTEVVAYAVIGAYLVSRLRLSRVGRPRLLATAMWSFLGAMVLAVLHSPFPKLALVRFGQLLVGVLLAVAIERGARRAELHRLAHGYVGLLLLSIPIGVLIRFPRQSAQQGRFNWLYIHPVNAGVFLSIGVVIAAAYLFDRRLRTMTPLPRWVYGGSLAMLAAALLATRTRGAMAAALVGVIVVGIGSRRPGRRLDAAALGVLGGATAVLLTASALGAFLARGQDAEEISTLSTRTEVWEMGWDLVSEQPLLGLGLTASRGAFLETFELGSAHNAMIEVLVDAGIIGAAAWLGLVGGVSVAAWRLATSARGRRLRHPDGVVLFALCAALIVNSLTDSGLGQPANLQSLWLFTLVGWVLLARRQQPPTVMSTR